MTTDCGLCAVLVLLDLSAEFDTIDHNILLKCLECEAGIHWFCSELVRLLPEKEESFLFTLAVFFIV